MLLSIFESSMERSIYTPNFMLFPPNANFYRKSMLSYPTIQPHSVMLMTASFMKDVFFHQEYYIDSSFFTNMLTWQHIFTVC